jgi:hypothetical protein
MSEFRKKPQGPFCQSCGVPMTREEMFGTEADGSKSGDYCGYCYQEGNFTQPRMTQEQMTDQVIRKLIDRQRMEPERARTLVNGYMPRLKRWQKK